MKRVLILSAVFILSATLGSLQAIDKSNDHVVVKMPILVGYQTNTSQVGSYQITVYVEYNPNTSSITFVTAQDQWMNDVDVLGYSGTMVNNGGILEATNFRVDLDMVVDDYVILNGALTMV